MPAAMAGRLVMAWPAAGGHPGPAPRGHAGPLTGGLLARSFDPLTCENVLSEHLLCLIVVKLESAAIGSLSARVDWRDPPEVQAALTS
jgi:hypothetical protein